MLHLLARMHQYLETNQSTPTIPVCVYDECNNLILMDIDIDIAFCVRK
jgi:hypothetical protein